MSKRVTTKSLADQIEMELDEALVRLWDAGLEEIESENSLIPSKKINQAKATLGIKKKNELTKISFWMNKLSLSHSEFIVFCDDLEIPLSPELRKLPKGALKKLRSYAKRKNIILGDEPLERKKEHVEDNGPFVLPKIGHDEIPKFLSFDAIKSIHDCLVQDFQSHFDPISPPGIKSENLLQSAVFRQETSFGEVYKYNTPELACAALTHSIVNNHAFHNGNKRTALVSMLVFLDMNNIVVTCFENDLFKFILRVAQHRLVAFSNEDYADKEVSAIANWIVTNSRKIESGDRVLTRRRLERILKEYGCEIEQVSGFKYNISRQRKMKRYFKLISKEYRTQISMPPSGDVPIDTIKKIRKDLALDDANGIDSAFFYGKESQKIDDFINSYRQTLTRLAKL